MDEAKFEMYLKRKGKPVALDDEFSVNIQPAPADRLSELAGLLTEALDLKDLIAAMVAGDVDNAQMATLLAELMVKVPDTYAKVKELLQPHIDAPLGKLTAYDVCFLVVECLASSFDPGQAGWSHMGNRLRAMTGQTTK